MTNEELLIDFGKEAATAFNQGLNLFEMPIYNELLRRLGAAVSASPQPSVEVRELMRGGENGRGVPQHEVVLGKLRIGVFSNKDSADKFAADVRGQFFAAAPAQEPESTLLLAKEYADRCVFECGEDNLLDGDSIAKRIEQALIAFGKHILTGKAAQEQPVENSRSATGAINGCGCVCHTVGIFGLMCCPCTKQDLDELVNGKRGIPVAPQPTER